MHVHSNVTIYYHDDDDNDEDNVLEGTYLFIYRYQLP